MAGSEEVLSDASDKSTSDDQYLKCCATKTCKIKVCVQCSSIYHRGCMGKYPNITKLGGNKILCCKISQQVDMTNQNDPEKKLLMQQITFLQQILEEVRDKNKILQLNNKLLLDKIETLENNDHIKKDVNSASKQNENLQKPPSYSRITRSANSQQMASIPTMQVPVRSTVPRNSNRNNADMENVNNQQSSIIKIAEEDNNEFKTVTYRKKRPKKNLGTAEVSEDESKNGFSGAERKVWLYVYRVNRVETSKQILEYITKKPGFDEHNTNVEEIPSENGQLKRFLVTAPLSKKEIMYQSEFWPKNVGVKRFNFEKK